MKTIFTQNLRKINEKYNTTMVNEYYARVQKKYVSLVVL